MPSDPTSEEAKTHPKEVFHSPGGARPIIFDFLHADELALISSVNKNFLEASKESLAFRLETSKKNGIKYPKDPSSQYSLLKKLETFQIAKDKSKRKETLLLDAATNIAVAEFLLSNQKLFGLLAEDILKIQLSQLAFVLSQPALVTPELLEALNQLTADQLFETIKSSELAVNIAHDPQLALKLTGAQWVTLIEKYPTAIENILASQSVQTRLRQAPQGVPASAPLSLHFPFYAQIAIQNIEAATAVLKLDHRLSIDSLSYVFRRYSNNENMAKSILSICFERNESSDNLCALSLENNCIAKIFFSEYTKEALKQTSLKNGILLIRTHKDLSDIIVKCAINLSKSEQSWKITPEQQRLVLYAAQKICNPEVAKLFSESPLAAQLDKSIRSELISKNQLLANLLKGPDEAKSHKPEKLPNIGKSLSSMIFKTNKTEPQELPRSLGPTPKTAGKKI